MAAMENDFENTTISLYGTVPDSIVDGPGRATPCLSKGARTTVRRLNPESQPADGGTETTRRPFWPIFAPTASCTT